MVSLGGSSLASTGVAAAAVSVISFFSSFVSVGVSDICHTPACFSAVLSEPRPQDSAREDRNKLYMRHMPTVCTRYQHRLLTFRARERPARSVGRDGAMERAPRRWRRPADGAGAKASVPLRMASRVTAEMTSNFIALLWTLFSRRPPTAPECSKDPCDSSTCFYGSHETVNFCTSWVTHKPIQGKDNQDAAKASPLW